jgi:hypothetical protein
MHGDTRPARPRTVRRPTAHSHNSGDGSTVYGVARTACARAVPRRLSRDKRRMPMDSRPQKHQRARNAGVYVRRSGSPSWTSSRPPKTRPVSTHAARGTRETGRPAAARSGVHRAPFHRPSCNEHPCRKSTPALPRAVRDAVGRDVAPAYTLLFCVAVCVRVCCVGGGAAVQGEGACNEGPRGGL